MSVTLSERLGLNTFLLDASGRLARLELILSSRKLAGPRWSSAPLDALRIFLGSWPALSIVFLALFFHPLQEALLALPGKMRSAQEISIGGISLKSTLERVASDPAQEALAKTLPQLSGSEVELLMKVPKDGLRLVHLLNSAEGKPGFTDLALPSDRVISDLMRLQTSELIDAFGTVSVVNHTSTTYPGQEKDPKVLARLIPEIRNTYPGSVSKDGREQVIWKLDVPLLDESRYPDLYVRRTTAGSAAVDLILSAVGQALTLSSRTEIAKD